MGTPASAYEGFGRYVEANEKPRDAIAGGGRALLTEEFGFACRLGIIGRELQGHKESRYAYRVQRNDRLHSRVETVIAEMPEVDDRVGRVGEGSAAEPPMRGR